jgi:hypothetical protein
MRAECDAFASYVVEHWELKGKPVRFCSLLEPIANLCRDPDPDKTPIHKPWTIAQKLSIARRLLILF